MRALWTAAVLVLATACVAGPSPVAGSTASPGPVASVAQATASPGARASVPASPSQLTNPSALPLTTVDFSCQLPVYSQDGPRTAGAFISFPGLVKTTAAEGGLYYDRAVARWLPVARSAISPDGRRYAYSEGTSLADPAVASRVHVVDAATGVDQRVVTMPVTRPYWVVDFTSTGIFLAGGWESTEPGVWMVDPDTSAVTKASDGFAYALGPTWIGVIDPRDPNPYTNAMDGLGQPNRIDRRDDFGATTTWFYEPGYSLAWVALTGSPALLVEAVREDRVANVFAVEYWLVRSPGAAQKLYGYVSHASDVQYLALDLSGAIADAHGLWINGYVITSNALPMMSSLYLVRRDGAFLRVVDGDVHPANGCL